MFRKTLFAATATVIAVSASVEESKAGIYNDRPTTIWVTIEAYPGEGLWQACRRVYQRDVFKVRGGPDYGLVRCEIDHSRLNG